MLVSKLTPPLSAGAFFNIPAQAASWWLRLEMEEHLTIPWVLFPHRAPETGWE